MSSAGKGCTIVFGSWDERDEAIVLIKESASLRSRLAGMTSIAKELLENEGIPRHAHAKPGIWDEDNGALAGEPCQWCAFLERAKQALAKAKEVGG